MKEFYFIVGYIVIALITYFILVYKDLSIDSCHEVYNSGDADSPSNVAIAVFWPFALAMFVCIFPFWACYKLAFKLKEKLNPREVKPNSLNKNKTYQSCG